MPKKHRLTHADFARSLKVGARRVHGTYFSLSLSAPEEGSESVKIACVVSKKVAARAVDRNLIRRRCREAMRVQLPRIHAPLTLAFHAKKGAEQASSEDIGRDVAALVDRGIGAT